MNLDQFVDWAPRQGPLLYGNNSADAGQCVQLVMYYVIKVLGLPVIWDDAYGWFADGRLANVYDRIPYAPGKVPPRGAIVVWGPSLPGSGGLGHIGVFLDGNASIWTGLDSNWGGKTAHKVTHNWSYVVGWLVPKGSSPVIKGDEMIDTPDQARDAYALLRGSRDALSQDELDTTVGHRTWASFATDARGEIAAREANKRAQAEQLAAMSNTINQLNQAVTAAQSDDALDKQKVAELTAQLETAHDQLADLQEKAKDIQNASAPNVPEKSISWVTRLIAYLTAKKKS